MHQALLIAGLTTAGVVMLVIAALHDISFRTVPNMLSLLLLADGAVLRVIDQNLQWGLLAAAVVFALTFLLWRFGLMGGGDLKLLTAATLFVAPWRVPDLLATTAVAGGALALVYFLGGRLVTRPAGPRPAGFVARVARCERWRLHRSGPLPYAVAIAAGGALATLAS